jgi:hypothetical protein
MTRKKSSNFLLSSLERRRLLSTLAEMRQARENGHRILIGHAEAVIDEALGKPHEVYSVDTEGLGKDLETLKNAAERLRPHCPVPEQWLHFQESCFILEGQRNPQENKRDKRIWHDVVIGPMKEYHGRVIEELDELCRRVRGMKRSREPGRKPKRPKSIKLALNILQQKKPPKFAVIYNRCKDRYPEEHPPGLRDARGAFEQEVRRAQHRLTH